MIAFTKVRKVKSPNRGTLGSAGFDFFIPEDQKPFELYPGRSINIPSGIKMVIPHGYVGIFFNKSGVGVKGVQVGACVVDSDYRGEVHLNVHNMTIDSIIHFDPGQKLVQMLIMPLYEYGMTEIGTDEYKADYDNTERGSGGFGSTGIK